MFFEQCALNVLQKASGEKCCNKSKMFFEQCALNVLQKASGVEVGHYVVAVYIDFPMSDGVDLATAVSCRHHDNFSANQAVQARSFLSLTPDWYFAAIVNCGCEDMEYKWIMTLNSQQVLIGNTPSGYHDKENDIIWEFPSFANHKLLKSNAVEGSMMYVHTDVWSKPANTCLKEFDLASVQSLNMVYRKMKHYKDEQILRLLHASIERMKTSTKVLQPSTDNNTDTASNKDGESVKLPQIFFEPPNVSKCHDNKAVSSIENDGVFLQRELFVGRELVCKDNVAKCHKGTNTNDLLQLPQQSQQTDTDIDEVPNTKRLSLRKRFSSRFRRQVE